MCNLRFLVNIYCFYCFLFFHFRLSPLQLTFVDSMAEMFGPLLAGIPLWAPPPLFIQQRGVAGNLC